MFTVVRTVDSKTTITAELGGGFTADPPKRVADVDVPASMKKKKGKRRERESVWRRTDMVFGTLTQ
ncbi:hypothetical protein LXL04_020177 [Taraxacum kok-saghyz]